MNNMVRIKDSVYLDSRQAISMGYYLQKTNIIKNFRKDFQEGRNFWPSCLFDGIDLAAVEYGEVAMPALEKMVASALSESRDAFEYAASVPYSLEGYRKFLLLPAFMATENLRLMKNNKEIFTSDAGVKIPKSRMPEILCMAEEASRSNEALWKFKKELEPAP